MSVGARWRRVLLLVAVGSGCTEESSAGPDAAPRGAEWSEQDVVDAIEAAKRRAAEIEAQREREAADAAARAQQAAPRGEPESSRSDDAMPPELEAELRAERRRLAAEIDQLDRRIEPTWTEAQAEIEQSAARLDRALDEALRTRTRDR